MDQARAAPIYQEFPDATRHKDFRRLLEKERGIDAVIVATPVPPLATGSGVERVIEIELNEEEQQLLNTSTAHVKELVEVVQKLYPELA